MSLLWDSFTCLSTVCNLVVLDQQLVFPCPSQLAGAPLAVVSFPASNIYVPYSLAQELLDHIFQACVAWQDLLVVDVLIVQS